MTNFIFKVKMLYTLIPVLVDGEELVFVQMEEHMRLETTMMVARPSNVSMVIQLPNGRCNENFL